MPDLVMSNLASAPHDASGVATSYSSSPELSSPPRSISEPSSPAAHQLIRESHYLQHDTSPTAQTNGVDDHRGASGVAAAPAVPAEKIRKKPGRKPGSTNKPKPVDANGSSAADAARVKKPRKQREPRDPNAAPVKRKKKPSSLDDAVPEAKFLGAGKQTKITDMAMRMTDGSLSAPAVNHASQIGKYEDIPGTSFFHNSGIPSAAAPPSQSQLTGQHYQPVRSYDPVREMYSNAQVVPQLSHPVNRASASPSISSLVEPPTQIASSLPNNSFFTQSRPQPYDDDFSAAQSPAMVRVTPSPAASQGPNQPAAIPLAQNDFVRVPASESMQPAMNTIVKRTISNPAVSTASSPTVPSPKPSKAKDPVPPPLPGFSGMANGISDGTDFRAPTVVLHIPMNGETNKYVNFTRMAEERYGWDALHPRLAAQRDRLARVAAAGAALERNGSGRESGDEMSLDLSEGEGSNVEMGGMSDGRTGTDGGAKKPVRKRKMKEDEYDKDDGFVDDTELLWEEQAAASKDGFFVYSGPLVPAGEKPALDRSVSTSTGDTHGQADNTMTGMTELPSVDEAPEEAVGAPEVPLPPAVVEQEAVRVLVEAPQRASRVSRKPTEHAWKWRSKSERKWARWLQGQTSIMEEECSSWHPLRAWAVRRWCLINEGCKIYWRAATWIVSTP